jgi:hypothetical protein
MMQMITLFPRSKFSECTNANTSLSVANNRFQRCWPQFANRPPFPRVHAEPLFSEPLQRPVLEYIPRLRAVTRKAAVLHHPDYGQSL